LTTDTVPREESKRFQICIPLDERVIFTEALEEDRVCMDRRDARNSKNNWGKIFPDEGAGPVVYIELLEVDNCQAPEHSAASIDAPQT